jgi:uncharacterized membrane-anchored protein
MKYSNKLIFLVAFFFVSFSFGQDVYDNEIKSLEWIAAPNKVKITERAILQLTGDQLYLDSANTTKFLKINGNLPRDKSFTIAHGKENWFAIFDFHAEGYVKDDEEIDAGALLSALKEGNERSITERKSQGLPLLYLQGWHIPPHYDKESKRLEWATNIRDEQNNPIVNFTTRILGKSGYMSATLVSQPDSLERDIASFKSALRSFEYVDGERYSEWRDGDKVAAYGLGALVVGGAAAAVASKGGFKFLWALILAALAAIVSFLKRIIGKK